MDGKRSALGGGRRRKTRGAQEEEWKEKMKREMMGWNGDLAAAETGG